MRITGSGTFTPNNSGLLARLSAAALESVTKVSAHVLQQAQIIVPIDTGALYDSGSSSSEMQGNEAVGTVGFAEDYAGFVEFGTVKMDAEPYLRPALDASHDLLIDTAADKLKGALGA